MKRIRFFVSLCLLFVFLLIVGFFGWRATREDSRLNVLIATNPLLIFSWEQSRGSTMIVLPSEGTIEAVHGYGRYALSALWQLGALEKKDGRLLVQSLEETLALPLPFYLGQQQIAEIPVKDPMLALHHFFNPTGLSAYLGRKLVTNLPLSTYFALWRQISLLSPEKIEVLDFRQKGVFKEISLPDGTKQAQLDSNVSDALMADNLEEADLRDEATTLAIYNTTAVSGLGNQIARLITHLGGRVVLVKNDSPAVGQCQLSGEAGRLKSGLAQFVQKHYDCEPFTVEETGRADLILRIGDDYAAKFR